MKNIIVRLRNEMKKFIFLLVDDKDGKNKLVKVKKIISGKFIIYNPIALHI